MASLAEPAALAPATQAELAAMVADAAARSAPVEVIGGGTRRGLGRPVQAAATLTTGGLRGITLYEPAEMVIAARAGTPLAEVEATLAAAGQCLAFEPMDHRPLLGSSGEPTIGAVAAVNVSGPRRLQAGAARDALIGVRAVNGRGEPIQSGGRVMKNVTGYDLVKTLAGSWGTLAILSEVTFKVLPVAETEATLVLSGLGDEDAVRAMTAALATPFEVSGAAHRIAARGAPATTLLRVEGFAASVAYRCARLADRLAPYAAVDRLDAAASRAAWRDIRDGRALAGSARPLWRLVGRAGSMPRVVATLMDRLSCDVLYDWGGALAWLEGGEGRDAGAPLVRAAATAAGVHATLVRAAEPVRAVVDVFEPPAPAVRDLSLKLKHAFDPAGILNPGRMFAGI